MPEVSQSFQVGKWLVDPAAGSITAGKESRHLPPRLMRLLGLLVEHAGQTVSRETLIEELWPRGFVNEEALSRSVNELRGLLDDNARAPQFILTVPKQGYRLIAKAGPARPRNRGLLVAGVAAAALLAVVLVVAVVRDKDLPEPADILPTAKRISANPGLDWQPEISADGKWAAEVTGRNGVGAVQLISTVSPEQRRELTHEAGLYSPVFSPSGDRVATLSGGGNDCQLLIWPVAGDQDAIASAELVTDCHRRGLLPALDWSADGAWIAFTRLDEDSGAPVLARVRLADGSIQPLTRLGDSYRSDMRPRFSPDGRWLSFSRGTRGVRELLLLDLQNPGQEPRQLTHDGQFTSGHDWWPDGKSIVLDSDRNGSRALWRLDLDGNFTLLGARDAQLPSVTESGMILFQVAQFEANIWRLDLETGEPDETAVVSSTKYDSTPAWSPDGSEIAFSSNRLGEGGIWIASADGSRPRQVYVPESGRAVGPAWLADGSGLLATEYAPGEQKIVRIALNRRQVTDLPTTAKKPYAPSESADSNWVYYLGSGAQGDSQLWRMNATGEGAQQRVLDGPLNGYQLADDGYLYFTRYGSAGLLRTAADGSGQPEPVLAQVPPWAGQDWVVRNGVVYHAADDGLYRFDIASEAYEKFSEVFAASLGPSLSVHPDGRQMLVATSDRAESDLFLAGESSK